MKKETNEFAGITHIGWSDETFLISLWQNHAKTHQHYNFKEWVYYEIVYDNYADFEQRIGQLEKRGLINADFGPFAIGGKKYSLKYRITDFGREYINKTFCCSGVNGFIEIEGRKLAFACPEQPEYHLVNESGSVHLCEKHGLEFYELDNDPFSIIQKAAYVLEMRNEIRFIYCFANCYEYQVKEYRNMNKEFFKPELFKWEKGFNFHDRGTKKAKDLLYCGQIPFIDAGLKISVKGWEVIKNAYSLIGEFRIMCPTFRPGYSYILTCFRVAKTFRDSIDTTEGFKEAIKLTSFLYKN